MRNSRSMVCLPSASHPAIADRVVPAPANAAKPPSTDDCFTRVSSAAASPAVGCALQDARAAAMRTVRAKAAVALGRAQKAQKQQLIALIEECYRPVSVR